MKKIHLIGISTIAMSALALTGCLSHFINPPADYEGEKLELAYHYSDYLDHNYYDMDYCPTSGTPKLLIIPTWFTNSSSYISESKKSTVKADIENAYFGTTSSTGWNSVSTYYNTLSNNTLTLTGVVSDWWSCGLSSSTVANYGDSSSLVNSAVNWYFSQSGSDSRKSFDTDGNGHLDGVMLIYACPNYDTLGQSSNNLWAYCFWTENDANISNPTPGVFFWASYDFMYGSVSDAVSHTGKSYYYGNTDYCEIDTHTYIHEMGHVFGLDDYYDYTGNTSPAGALTMQDANVCCHDPFSAMALGWANPYIVTSSCSITINDFQSSHDLILVTNEWNTFNSPFDEYLLLELYTPTGLNAFDCNHSYYGYSTYQGPKTPGIRVWHVDARLTHWVENSYNSYFTTSLSANPTIDLSYLAMSNTSYDSEYEGYYSFLGKSYCDYNLLQLIRNNTSETYKSQSVFNKNDLFTLGDTFSLSQFSKQFVKGTKMNNGNALNLSFTVNSLSSTSATLSFY